ncbi:MAG: tetratricopeptide repeat protein [Patescibacteria group bacterium]
MLLTWILIGIIAACLGAIVFLIIRKIPQVKTLDISTVPKEKEQRVKEKILIDRLRRKTSKSKEVMLKGLLPSFAKFSEGLKSIYRKAQDLEKKYKREEVKSEDVNSPEFKKKIDKLLSDAADDAKREEFEEAEKKFIEIVSIAPQEKRAYKGLGDLYFKKKEYKQALETYKFVLKLDIKGSEEVVREENGQKVQVFSNSIDLADDHVDIGEVCLALEKIDQAVDSFKKAVSLEPNNPRNLDLLIDASIKSGNKVLAVEALNALKRINPENQKLREYDDLIVEMKLSKKNKGMNYLW